MKLVSCTQFNFSRPGKKRSGLLRLLALCLIVLAAAAYTVFFPNQSSFAQKAQQNKDVGKSAKDLSGLKADLESYIGKHEGTYGIYYINLVDGSSFGINDTEAYKAASTVKVPINLYLCREVEEGRVKLDQTMAYTPDDYESGAGSIQYEEYGTDYTVRELSRLSIEESDNVAKNMLVRLLGRSNFKDYMRQMGGLVVNDGDNLSSPKDMALYMKKTYEYSKSNPELGGMLINYLENTIYNDRLPAKLPENVKVAHKIGNYEEVVNDVGIVYADKPYVLAVMSKNADQGEANDVIATISKMVYQNEGTSHS